MCISKGLTALSLLSSALPQVIKASHELCDQQTDHPHAGAASLLALDQRRSRSEQTQSAQKLGSHELRGEHVSSKEEERWWFSRKGGGRMMSTPDGVCMYELPDKFNVGLLDSKFKQPEPQPMKISSSKMPPLEGMFDTNQFSLERIFFDRMRAIATQTREAKDCKAFYIPYFAAWETGPVDNLWTEAQRPELNRELFTHLTYYNALGQTAPEQLHFMIIGRCSQSMKSMIQAQNFKHIMKFAIEDSFAGAWSAVYAVPYPTWFRYEAALEPTNAAEIVQHSISIIGASYKAISTGSCSRDWLGNLTAQLSTACNGKMWCSFWLHKSEHAYISEDDLCPVVDVLGNYTCGNATLSFSTSPDDVANGRVVVLSCNRGPRWLLGSSAPLRDQSGELTEAWLKDTDIQVGQGPLAALLGSVSPREYDRRLISEMCQQRPSLCVIMDTGTRGNSSAFMKERLADMYQILSASTFCINPNGDSPTRKGLFDALVLGCIPVVTSEDSLSLHRLHIPDWQSVSVLVPAEKLYSDGFNLFDYLKWYASEYPDQVLQKQMAIRQAAYSLQYSVDPESNQRRGPDAFDIIIRHVLSSTSWTEGDQSSASAASVNGTSKRNEASNLLSQGSEEFQKRFLGLKSNVFLHADVTNNEDPGSSESGLGASVWQVRGAGDGSCCYRIVNAVSQEVLVDMGNKTNGRQVVTREMDKAWQWKPARWRFTQRGASTYVVTNVDSGRQLFARLDGQPGMEGNITLGLGAAFAPSGVLDQKWILGPEMIR